MAKIKPKNIPQQKKPTAKVAALPLASQQSSVLPLTTFWQQAIFLIVIGLVFYYNSFYNKYALDDDIVMRLNTYVQDGFSGIPKIMSTDAYDSFFKSMGSAGELSGGRYRPLSIVTFAIEQGIFGDNPMERHIASVLFYILSVVVLLKFLRDYLFKYISLPINSSDLAFFTSLIFLIHPLHTEVVSNVKSRDEILSFLFIILSLQYAFRFSEEKNRNNLLLGMLCYFCALLSKEWGITLVALIPMMFFIFKKQTIGESIKTSLPFFAVAIFYFVLRYKVVGAGRTQPITEVLNNPFAYATAVQTKATEIFVLLKYLKLIFIPYPLSADYSYNTIPYKNFGDAFVWLSIFVHGGIVIYFLNLLRKRNWLAFAFGFYLAHLFLVSNLAMPIGATMGERLLYHSSLGFAMAIGFLLLTLLNKINFSSESGKQFVAATAMVALIVPDGCITISRNADWKTDNILFMHDAWVVPNSVLANGNSGKAFIELAQVEKDSLKRKFFLDSAIFHLIKSVRTHPKYVNGYLNLGLAKFHQKDLDSAEYYWNMARKYFPTHPFFKQSYDPALAGALVDKAKQLGKMNRIGEAISLIHRALRYDSTNVEVWYHYGGANFSAGKLNEAYRAWTKALQLNPNHAETKQGMQALMQAIQQQQQQINRENKK